MAIPEPIVKVRASDLISMGKQLRRQKQAILAQRATQMGSQLKTSTKSAGGERIDRAKLKKVLDETGPYEENTLFIGIGDDGLPVLLDLEEPAVGSVLFIGDQFAGKRPQLKVIAAAIEELHSAEDVKFAVITDDPNKWRDLQFSPNCLNVFSYFDNNTAAFIEGVMNWASVNEQSGQAIILLLEHIDHFAYLPPFAQQNLRWLLQHGPEHKVWPIATIETAAYHSTQMDLWRSVFGLNIYGKMLSSKADFLTHPPVYERKRGEFILESKEGLIRFRVPGVI